MIKLINQPSNQSGCGIAVFAMASSLTSYFEAEVLMERHGWILNNGNVLVRDMKLALDNVFGKGRIETSYSEPKMKSKYVLFVKYQSIYRHWLFVEDGFYYDPLPRFTSPRGSINYQVTRALSLPS